MNLDDQLHDLLRDDAASATPPSDSLDAHRVVRRARRRRIAAVATTAVVSAAVVVIFVLSLSVLLPREGDDTQPGGPGLANATVEPWTDEMTHLPLVFVSLDYPSTWYALIGDSQTGPEASIDTVQITNFDPGFDDDLCLQGGSEIPSSGIVAHLSSSPLPFKIGAAETREDAASLGANIPQSCVSSAVYADHLDGMWIVLVAGPNVAAADLDAFMTTMEKTAEPDAAGWQIDPYMLDGTAAVLSAGPSGPMVLGNPNEGGASLIYSTTHTARILYDLRSVPKALGRISVGMEGGRELSIAGLAGPEVASVRYQDSEGTIVFDTPTVRVPTSAFGKPARAFAGSGTGPDGPITGQLTAFDASGNILLDTNLAPFGLADRFSDEIDVSIDVAQSQVDADAALGRAAAAATAWFGSNASYTTLTPEDLNSIDPNVRVCLGEDCGLNDNGLIAKDGLTIQMTEPFEDFVTFRALIPTGVYDGFVRCLVVRGSAIGEIRSPSDPNPTKGCASSDEFVPPAITKVLLDRAQIAATRWQGDQGTFAGMTPAGLSEIDPSLTWCDGLDDPGNRAPTDCVPPLGGGGGNEPWPPQVVLTYVDDASAVFNVIGSEVDACFTIGEGPTKTYPFYATTPGGCSEAGIQDKVAQSTLRNALVAGKVSFTDCDCFTRVTPREMGAIEPAIEFNEGDLGRPLEVSIRDISRYTMLLVTRSRSGHVYCIADVESGPDAGTHYGTSDAQTIDECHKPRWPENGEYP